MLKFRHIKDGVWEAYAADETVPTVKAVADESDPKGERDNNIEPDGKDEDDADEKARCIEENGGKPENDNKGEIPLAEKLNAMTDEQLRAFAEENGVTIPGTVTKRDTVISTILKKIEV